ncbi:hypothetical protein [Streptomyces acidiscabies]|uniref:Uncharacterized protein n=1 Tax=Streptomyces acidiscabies TaxID=42234 RepID=A0A0L0KHK3_9ACTN|nr:hypothetical protein [Streptomyces acidiscabies]KND37266.1 hypothetical protein IQ63_10095 [Streptomyces acidiscabies]
MQLEKAAKNGFDAGAGRSLVMVGMGWCQCRRRRRRGRTSLVRQWDCTARELGAATARLGDDVHSVVEAMEAISAQLRHQGTPSKGFEKLLAVYRQRRHEAETPLPGGIDGAGGGAGYGSAPSVSSTATVAAQAGLGLPSGLGPIAGAMDPQQLA